MGSPENLDMKQVILLIALALATPILSVPVDGSERVLDVAGCLALKAGKTLGAGLLPFGGFGAGVIDELLCKEILKPKEPEFPKIPGLPEIPKIPGLPEIPEIPDSGKDKGKGKHDNGKDHGKDKDKGKDDHGKKGKDKGKDKGKGKGPLGLLG